MRRRLDRRTFLLCSTLLVTVAGAVLALLPAEAASANFDGYRVTGVGRGGLRVRANAQSANAAVIGTLANRTRVSIVCGARGRAVFGSTVWHQISSPVAGWVSGRYLTTGGNRLITGERTCSSTATAVRFNGAAAAAWAAAHAQDAQGYKSMCAWFASNALWQGGIPKNSKWTDQASYRDGRVIRRGTMTANFVSGVRSQILGAHLGTEISLGDMSTQSVPAARPGDLIIYDWDGNGVRDHVAVIVNIAMGQYPEVAEWGSSLWPNNRSSYVKRGWTWSENYHVPQQARLHGKGRAYLLHITV